MTLDNDTRTLIADAGAWIAKRAVYAYFGRDSAESDIVSDYLEQDPPDWRAAARAATIYARQRP